MRFLALVLALVCVGAAIAADPPPNPNARHILAQAPTLPQAMLPAQPPIAIENTRCRCDCALGDECVCVTGQCNCKDLLQPRTMPQQGGWQWDPNRRVWYRYVIVQPTYVVQPAYYAPQPRFGGFGRGGRGGC